MGGILTIRDGTRLLDLIRKSVACETVDGLREIVTSLNALILVYYSVTVFATFDQQGTGHNCRTANVMPIPCFDLYSEKRFRPADNASTETSSVQPQQQQGRVML